MSCYRHFYEQVHVIQQSRYVGSTLPSYNCAVAIQAASDVFIIYGCDQQHKWIIRRLNCEQSKGAYLEIFEKVDGKQYEVCYNSRTNNISKNILRVFI